MIAKATFNLGTADGDVVATFDADDNITLLKQAEFIVRSSVAATCIEVSRAMGELGFRQKTPRELHPEFIADFGSTEVLLALEYEDGTVVPFAVGISLAEVDLTMDPNACCPGNEPMLNGQPLIFMYNQRPEGNKK